MNRNLMAGCAAVALTLGCGSALAQSTFNIGLGGDAFFEAGFVSQDRDTDLRSHEFINRFRLVITPTAKADNGLEYGARLRLRANGTGAGTQTTADGDRMFVFMQTPTLGRLELGSVNGPSDQTYIGRPQDWQMLGLYDEFRRFLPATLANTTGGNGGISGTDSALTNAAGTEGMQLLNSSGAGSKINYFSPRFAGFQVGLSYMPRTDSFLTDVNRNKYGTAAGYHDVFELTANYAGEFSGVSVKASGGYTGGSANEVSNTVAAQRRDLQSYQVGGRVGYAGFELGAGYVWSGKSGQGKTAAFQSNQDAWNVGVQYTTGPVVVGLGFQRSEDAGSTALVGKRQLDFFTVGAMYTVAPGLRTGLEYTYFDADSDQVNTATTSFDDKGSIVLLRSVVTF